MNIFTIQRFMKMQFEVNPTKMLGGPFERKKIIFKTILRIIKRACVKRKERINEENTYLW